MPSFKDHFDKFKASPQTKSAGDKFKKLETGVWRALDPLGKKVNQLAGRLGAESFWPTELAEGEIDKAARILRTFTLDGAAAASDDEQAAGEQGHDSAGPAHHSDPHASRKTQRVIRKIPPKALQQACGVAIFTCFRTGFGLSGASGSGVVVARLPDGSWSAPSGLLIHTIGYGFLVGLDVYDVVLVIRKRETLEAFTKPKISIGGEFSAAAGPVGNGAVLDAGLDAKPVWSYTKSKGAYIGVQLDGTVILKREDANARFYGRKVSTADIFAGSINPAPTQCRPLFQTLYAAEGRPQVLGTDAIPQGQTPGDKPISQEEASVVDEQAKAAEQEQQQQHEQHGGEAAGLATGAGVGAGAAVGAGAGASSGSAGGDQLPPAYDDADPFSNSAAAPPPPHSEPLDGPRDAAAEKEALRRKYAQEDEGTSLAGGASSARAPTRVRAQFDFKGAEPGDLSFAEGEVIDVEGIEGGDSQWYRGSIGGTRRGIFPANYVVAL